MSWELPVSSAPFDIDLVIKRIQESVPELREVAGRADYAAITRLVIARPRLLMC